MLLAAAAVVATVQRLYGQAGTGQGQSNRRYLFIVETSRNMQKRAQGVHDTLKALLDSNLNGQILTGDSVAIWTFNEAISTNFFSAVAWSSTVRASLIARLPDFLDASMYEKRATLDKVIPRLDAQVATDGLLTAILVTTGEEEVQGTPFDNQLRRSFSQWRADQQRSRMPILTLLRGNRGRFNEWSVSAAPWPLEIPPLEVRSTARKTNDAASANLPLTNSPVPPTDAAMSKTFQTNPAPVRTNIATTTNTPAVTLKTNFARPANKTIAPEGETNPLPTVAAATETNAPSIAATNLPQVAIEPTKTNMVAALPADPPATQGSDPSDPPGAASHSVSFSADIPRPGEATQFFVAANHPDEPIPTSAPPPPSTAQTNTSAPATAVAPNPISSSPTPNLIPPIEDPSSKPPQVAMTTPSPHSFFHENIKWIVGGCVSVIVAIFCALLWLGTYSRNQLNLASLPGNKRPQK